MGLPTKLVVVLAENTPAGVALNTAALLGVSLGHHLPHLVGPMARGWIQGWPKKLGSVHTTRVIPVPSPAAPQVEEGGRFAASLAVNDRRLAEAEVTLERVSEDPMFLGRRQVINVRHFPRLSAGQHDQPAVHELVRSQMTNVTRTPVWEGSACLRLFAAPDQELDALGPREVRRGYRYRAAFEIGGLEVLRDLTVR